MALLLSNDERIRRLKIASDRVNGDANLGRLIGYKDGAFIGQMLRGDKTISEKTIQKLIKIKEIADLFSWNAYTGFKTAENEVVQTLAPQPIDGPTERRLTRFLAVLYQIPDAQRAAALAEAIEVLLDHLPPPPTTPPGPLAQT